MFCHKCGVELPEGSRFCPRCGTAVPEIGAAPEKATKPAAVRKAPAPRLRSVSKTVAVVVPIVLVVLLVVFLVPHIVVVPPPSQQMPSPQPTQPTPTVTLTPTPTPAPPTTSPTPAKKQIPPKSPPPRAMQLPFEMSVVPEEAYYLPGEPVEVKFSLRNISSETIALSPYPPEIQAKPSQQDNVVFSVAAGVQQPEIKPNDSITVEFSWDQKDKAGKQVPPGWYDVTANITVIHGQGRFGGGRTARLLIRYPQGAVEKSLALNQSQTINGITLKLERVELTADGSSFYVFFVPPGYSVPPPPSTGPLPPSLPSISINARAEYSINGITYNAGLAGWGAKDGGIKLVWGGTQSKLNPIPRDAKELVFRVTMVLPKFGATPTTAEMPGPTEAPPPPTQPDKWEGPWEFRISLQ